MRDDLFFERIKAGMDAAFTKPCPSCAGENTCQVCAILEGWQAAGEEIDKDEIREAGFDPVEIGSQALSTALLAYGWPASWAAHLILGGTCPACEGTKECKVCDKGSIQPDRDSPDYCGAVYANCIEGMHMLRERGEQHAADILLEKTYAFLVERRKRIFAQAEANGGFQQESLDALKRAVDTLNRPAEAPSKIRVKGRGLTHEEMVELGLVDEEEEA